MTLWRPHADLIVLVFRAVVVVEGAGLAEEAAKTADEVGDGGGAADRGCDGQAGEEARHGRERGGGRGGGGGEERRGGGRRGGESRGRRRRRGGEMGEGVDSERTPAVAALKTDILAIEYYSSKT